MTGKRLLALTDECPWRLWALAAAKRVDAAVADVVAAAGGRPEGDWPF